MPTRPDWSAERLLWKQGYLRVAGVDEVGRGPLAGPVVAAAVVFPPSFRTRLLPGLRDSKQLTAKARERLAPQVRRFAAGVGIGSASPCGDRRPRHRRGDGGGHVPRHPPAAAVRRPPARRRAAPRMRRPSLPPHHPRRRSLRSIAAASIVAKVARDSLMVELDALHPGYGFARHKGYPTAEHLAALERLGPTPLHRRSFAPVRRVLEAGVAS